ncbi:hypothetical protein [Nitrobacter sp.]|jgi:hypothetical protein|uniref:hypothetical protein n=1 Tax=Nitrobacter sp. TaxID=29420 RepID=UPI0029CABEAF|nr:hypothetical protein [Nitrobacter sp.]
MLSSLDWKAIESSPRETNGFEMIPVRDISGSLPDELKSHQEVMVFRFGGGKRGGRIAGIRDGFKFSILFIDRNFKLYDHGG